MHLTVTTTSRTHCHFVMQARALRVPEVCVLIFVRTHTAACFCISLRCLRLSTSVLKGSRMCSCHPAPLSGIIHTTRATHSQHHTLLNSYKMVRSPHLCSHLLTHRTLLPRSAISSQVPACPTRNVTGYVMPLAEAITQLSFLEFLQRCNLLIAPLQPPQLPVPISLLDAAVQTAPPLISRSPRYLSTWQCRRLPTVSTPHLWMLPCRRIHTVLCLSTFLHRWVLAQLPRFLLMCLFRLLYAVLCCTMLPHNYRSRSSLLDVSSRTILWTAETLIVSPRHQCKTILVVTHHL